MPVVFCCCLFVCFFHWGPSPEGADDSTGGIWTTAMDLLSGWDLTKTKQKETKEGPLQKLADHLNTIDTTGCTKFMKRKRINPSLFQTWAYMIQTMDHQNKSTQKTHTWLHKSCQLSEDYRNAQQQSQTWRRKYIQPALRRRQYPLLAIRFSTD